MSAEISTCLRRRLSSFSAAKTGPLAKRPGRRSCRPCADCRTLFVGVTGIEPVTSSVSGKRSPAELNALCLPLLRRAGTTHRDTPCARRRRRGGGGNRTRVQGFAGPCLSHSATPPACPGPSTREATDHRLPKALLTPSAPPSGRRDSNPRPSPWQGDALPTEPRPHDQNVRPGCVQHSNRYARVAACGRGVPR